MLPTFEKILVRPLLLFFTHEFDSCALALLLGDPVLERSVSVLSLYPSQLLLYAMTGTHSAFQAVVPLSMVCLPYLLLDISDFGVLTTLLAGLLTIDLAGALPATLAGVLPASTNLFL